MLTIPPIRMAVARDASVIAEISRDYIEYGLGWSWTASRVLAAIRDRATNTAVLAEGQDIAGFGIMHYGEEVAHLSLLAVRRRRSRRCSPNRKTIVTISHTQPMIQARNRSAIVSHETWSG